jgi:hypothetical protein
MQQACVLTLMLPQTLAHYMHVHLFVNQTISVHSGWTFHNTLRAMSHALNFSRLQSHLLLIAPGLFQVGGLLDVVVKAAPDARGVVQVSSDPTQIASSVTREIPGLTLDALLPGG